MSTPDRSYAVVHYYDNGMTAFCKHPKINTYPANAARLVTKNEALEIQEVLRTLHPGEKYDVMKVTPLTKAKR